VISVEAMKKVVFSNLEEVEVEAETFHTWNITDWKTLSNKVYGPVFECGGHSWCVYPLLQAPVSRKRWLTRLAGVFYSTHTETTTLSIHPSTSSIALRSRGYPTIGMFAYNSVWFSGTPATQKYTPIIVRHECREYC